MYVIFVTRCNPLLSFTIDAYFSYIAINITDYLIESSALKNNQFCFDVTFFINVTRNNTNINENCYI